jgi:tryptophanyl-tRNA synthetase
MTRISGFKPTGSLQLGNYLGAISPALASPDTVIVVADLHALTVPHDPVRLRELTLENAATLLAAGLDPTRTLLYVQSHLTAHLEMHYLLECATGYGEAQRMIQFRELHRNNGHTRLSLLTYPVLMAADILLHGADEVPVGADQSQHLELARTIATRFNARYGPVFTVPRAVRPTAAARVKDLSDPTRKMGKSSASQAGVIRLLDPPDVIRRKVMRAVTDTCAEVRHDPERQPGVANLLEILAACRHVTPDELATVVSSYSELKAAVLDEVLAVVRPIQHRYAEVRSEMSYLTGILTEGADRARHRTASRLRGAYAAIGLRPAA